MKIYKAVIVDDYVESREVIRELLRIYYPQIEVVGDAKSIKSAEKSILNKNPDLVFLDIKMGSGEPSFGLLERLYNKSYFKFKVIFVSAYRKEYAEKVTYYLNIPFLDKPIDKNKFRESVDYFLNFFEKEENDKEMRLFFDWLKTGQFKQKCIESQTGKIEFVEIKDILYIEAYKGGTKVYVINRGLPLFCKEPLKEISKTLKNDFGFEEVGRKHTINELQRKNISGGNIYFHDGSFCTPTQRGLEKYKKKKLIDPPNKKNITHDLNKLIRWLKDRSN